MHYHSEPFWHAPICGIASHSGTHNHSEPFRHAPMHYRSEPFCHAPTCGIASHSAAIIVGPPMTPAHALLREPCYRGWLLNTRDSETYICFFFPCSLFQRKIMIQVSRQSVEKHADAAHTGVH